MKLLIKKGADLNAVNVYHVTALILAINKGEHEYVKWFQIAVWTTFLIRFVFIFLGFDTAAEYLIRKGANVNIIGGQDGNTALTWAAFKGSKSLVELLLQNGADINHVNYKKNSALILSIDSARGNHWKCAIKWNP